MSPNGYQLLPTSAGSNPQMYSWQVPKWMARQSRIRPRQFVTAASTLALIFTTASLFYLNDSKLFSFQSTSWASDATNFDGVFRKEAELPQHNLQAKYPEGQDGRYLRFSNQVWGLGWNNILQERLLNTILAYESDRAPVFTPFEAWAHPPRNDTVSTGERQALSIPYNALVSGPTAGGSWGLGDRHPRAISDKWWEVVCPMDKRVVIQADDIFEKMGGKDIDGKQMVKNWSSLLKDIPDQCVEVIGGQIFDFYLIGSPRILPLWQSFSKHPVIQRLDDSQIVKAAVAQNIAKLQSPALTTSRVTATPRGGTIAGLVAVHLRRGDYLEGKGEEEGHCLHLSKWGSTYTGWNQLPQLYDTFNPPARGDLEWGQNTPELEAYYFEHCLPTPTQVASRLHALRRHSTRLSHVFVATNAEESYLAELRNTLVADGWSADGIVTSNDLNLNWQATSVSMAVDMSILSRAEVFVGNGFSSMTSNVVMRRLTTGMPLDSVRFW